MSWASLLAGEATRRAVIGAIDTGARDEKL
jgi:hypothetical protein